MNIDTNFESLSLFLSPEQYKIFDIYEAPKEIKKKEIYIPRIKLKDIVQLEKYNTSIFELYNPGIYTNSLLYMLNSEKEPIYSEPKINITMHKYLSYACNFKINLIIINNIECIMYNAYSDVNYIFYETNDNLYYILRYKGLNNFYVNTDPLIINMKYDKIYNITNDLIHNVIITDNHKHIYDLFVECKYEDIKFIISNNKKKIRLKKTN